MAKSEFVEVDTLRDRDGVGLVAPITVSQRPNGYRAFSFSIFKEFERTPGGPTERTNYLSDRHLGAVRKLIDDVEARIQVERDKVHETRRRDKR